MRHRLRRKLLLFVLAAIGIAVLAAGCGGGDGEEGTPALAPAPADPGAPPPPPAPAPADLSGRIEADGSSTVGPLTTLAAEEFQALHSDVQITVGISGSGGGFERFCRGETDLSNASRPIKDSEVEECQANGIDFVEFRVVTDALTVVVNPENDFVDCLTLAQLNTIWAPESEGMITNWNQVDPSFPDLELSLAGPGTDSGTFDYFTDEVNGDEGASRADYQASEDDNVIVQAVQGDRGGTGYFGFSYFVENPTAVKALEIDGGSGCVVPSVEAALAGDYSPLSRPLFVYAKVESFTRPEVQEFIRFYLNNTQTLAETALYVPLSAEQQADAIASFEAALATPG